MALKKLLSSYTYSTSGEVGRKKVCEQLRQTYALSSGRGGKCAEVCGAPADRKGLREQGDVLCRRDDEREERTLLGV